MRKVIGAIAIAAFAGAAILPVNSRAAYTFTPPSAVVKVRNDSTHNAWVDISFDAAWGLEIVKAFCVAPGQTSEHTVDYGRASSNGGAQMARAIRVRAEIKSGDCRTGNLRVLTEQNTFDSGRRNFMYSFDNTIIHFHR